MAAKRAVEECRLVDDVGADGHRLDRSRAASRSASPRSAIEPSVLDLDDVPAVGSQVREEARLVLEAAPADDVELGIVAHRPLDEAGQGRPFELGQVLAGQVGDEVRGRIDRPAVDAIHAPEP